LVGSVQPLLGVVGAGELRGPLSPLAMPAASAGKRRRKVSDYGVSPHQLGGISADQSAPEGIRTPNLLTYSAVSEGLTESTEMCLQQAFSAGRDIPIWVNPYESTDVCSGKVADSRFRRRAFRWRNSDGGRTCRNLVSEANSPVGPATGRQALTELIVHGESSALRTVPLMDVREWWRSGFPEFAANPRTRPLV